MKGIYKFQRCTDHAQVRRVSDTQARF